MPINKISVADGHLADWHRFDSPTEYNDELQGNGLKSVPAVIKDRHQLLSVADPGATYSGSNAWEQIKAIWQKLGGTGTPPRVQSFNREDLGKNEAGQVPGKPPTPILAFSAGSSPSFFQLFYLQLDFDIGGSAPTRTKTIATPTVGSPIETLNTLTYPYLVLVNQKLYSAGPLSSGTYTVQVQYENSFGWGSLSDPSTSFTVS